MSSAAEQVLAGGAGGYELTKVSRISESLSRLFSDLQEGSSVYTRAASTNVLIPVGSSSAVSDVERLIEDVARLHPSRFLIYGVNNALSAVAAEVSARCHFTSKGEGTSHHVCSELVRMGAPGSQVQALAEAIRANLVSGTPSELLLFDSQVEGELIEVAASMVDSIIFDSSMWARRLAVIEGVLREVKLAVDLQWIALGAWRDQVRAGFDFAQARGLASGLQRFTIVSDGLKDSAAQPKGSASEDRGIPAHCSMAGLLLCGWIAARLQLSLESVKRLSLSGSAEAEGWAVHFQSPSGATVICELISSAENLGVEPRFLAEATSVEPKVRSVRFEGTARGGKGSSFEINRRGLTLEARVEGINSVELSRPIEDETGDGRLRRFFLIGESVANYSAAMGRVLKLCAMAT